MSVTDKSVVLVPEGYHPVGTHTTRLRPLLLNTMAGPKREWIFHNDPDHDWIVNPGCSVRLKTPSNDK